MFPFNNGSLSPHFAFCFNYELINPSFYASEINPYVNQIFPQNQHENSFNFPTNNEQNVQRKTHHSKSIKATKQAKKNKKKIKMLKSISMEQKLLSIPNNFKSPHQNFQYFDPSMAPPLSTLRNQHQLRVDLEEQLISSKIQEQNVEVGQKDVDENLLKLQILMKQPNQNNYPFLICKKRKYLRNLKRRYASTYFQQRAYFIQNKIPIPPELHPQFKVKMSKKSQKNSDQADVDEYFNQDGQFHSNSENFLNPTNRGVQRISLNQSMVSDNKQCHEKFEIKQEMENSC